MFLMYSLAVGPTAAAALPKMYRYLRPPTRTVIGTTRSPRGYIANVVGVKPMRWSTRLGMSELKKVSWTCCAEAVVGASRNAATTSAGQRIKRVDHRAPQVSNGVRRLGAFLRSPWRLWRCRPVREPAALPGTV